MTNEATVIQLRRGMAGRLHDGKSSNPITVAFTAATTSTTPIQDHCSYGVLRRLRSKRPLVDKDAVRQLRDGCMQQRDWGRSRESRPSSGSWNSTWRLARVRQRGRKLQSRHRHSALLAGATSEDIGRKLQTHTVAIACGRLRKICVLLRLVLRTSALGWTEQLRNREREL